MNYLDNDLYPYDPEDVNRSVEECADLYRYVTGDDSIDMGFHEVNRYDFEIWLSRDGDRTQYFYNFDDVEDFIRQNYPDADWEK